MKHLIEKDKKHRRFFLRYEWKRVALKASLTNLKKNVKEELKEKEWQKFPRWSCFVRIRNRCQLSGRAGSVSRRFRLSRICLREQANLGNLPGVSRSSW